jgi:SAM-dependent methyltransferase
MADLTECRACDSGNLYTYLRLGDHPAANAFVREANRDTPDSVYPLDTIACLDCGMIQVADPLPPDFFVDYVYVPSGSTTMPVHFSALAKKFRQNLVTEEGQIVMDIGCNDGLLLAACKDEGMAVLGIDPSANIAKLARAKGVEVFNEYFTAESAQRVREQYGPAQVIVTTNTFNHIDNLHGFMDGVAALLADDGMFVIEVPQALTCVTLNEFDTVYHEHLSVLSAASVAALGKPVGLQIVDLEELPIHGGSMRFYLRRGGTPTAAVGAFMQRETDAGLFERQTYTDHAARVQKIRADLMALLDKLKAEGRRIAGYGAPAKGNTLLNYYGIGPDRLEFIADRNELKHGRLTPGMRIPVVSPDRISETQPDYLLMLAWNFRDEIIGQQQAFLEAGGKFIIPIPEVEIVGKEV